MTRGEAIRTGGACNFDFRHAGESRSEVVVVATATMDIR